MTSVLYVVVPVGAVAAVTVVVVAAARSRRRPPSHIRPGRARVAPAGGAAPAAVEVGRLLRRGVWCDRCLLSTAMEVDVIRDGAVVATLRGCERCRSGICHDTPSA